MPGPHGIVNDHGNLLVTWQRTDTSWEVTQDIWNSTSPLLRRPNNMIRVTASAGFFKARDPKALSAWYRDHLGIRCKSWGGAAFDWKGQPDGTTAWNIFPDSTKYFEPSKAPFMVNYRVADLVSCWRSSGRRGQGGREDG